MTIDWQMEADRANRLYGDASRRIEQLEERMRGADALIVLWETRATRAEARVEQLEASLAEWKALAIQWAKDSPQGSS
jgi:hypothetical protein